MVYVDDVFLLLQVPGGTAAEAQDLATGASGTLSASLTPKGGYQQNATKQDIILGPGWRQGRILQQAQEQASSQETVMPGRVMEELKHLGGWLSPWGSVAGERRARINSARAGWSALGKVWAEKAPYRAKSG